MIPRTSTLLLCFGFWFACTPQNPDVKRLEDPIMIDLLVDLSTLEASLIRTANPIKDSVRETYLKQLFELHQIDQEIMDYNLNILREDLQRMDMIYDSVHTRIERMNQNRSGTN